MSDRILSESDERLLERLVEPGHFEPTREDLWGLIQWLAIPYDTDPCFVVADEPPMVGITTDYRLRLKQTWETVIGSKGGAIVGMWGTCESCGRMIFLRDPLPEVMNNGN